MKILSISYCKIQQFHNKKVNEQRLLTSLSILSLKIPIFKKRNTCIRVVITLLLYVCLSNSHINTLFPMHFRETYSVFRVCHWVRKSGQLCHRVTG